MPLFSYMTAAKISKRCMSHAAGATVYPCHTIPDQDFSSCMKIHTCKMKMIISFAIEVLDNKTIIIITLFNLGEYWLILANLANSLVS